MYKFKFFDIETYNEFFCCVITTIDDQQNHIHTSKYCSDNRKVSSETINAIYVELADPNCYIISFNGKHFDLPLLAKLYYDTNRYKQLFPTHYIYTDAQNLISYDKFNNPIVKRHQSVKEWNIHHFDLLRCCLLDKSLKQWAMYNNFDIVEMPYAPDKKDLTKDECAEILNYCEYDCTVLAKLFFKLGYKDSFAGKPTFLAYVELFKMLEPEFQTRFDRTPGSLAALLIYKQTTPIAPITIDPLKLFNFSDFQVPVELKLLLATLAKNTIDKITTEYNGITYGKGGAHFSKTGFITDIYEFDVASQYPAIIILYRLLKTSEALLTYIKYRDMRLEIKHKPDMSYANQALKLILNSLSGSFRIKSTYSVVYDPAAGEAMCYIAQMIISELAFATDVKSLVEVNTDSVFVQGEEAAAKLRIKAVELSERFKLGFEEEHTDAIYFRDVNNYIKYSKHKTIDNDWNVIGGKGDAYSDLRKKQNMPAVYKILFGLLPKDHLPASLPWRDHSWEDYIFKYHKSAAAKYGTIDGKPLTKKNYYFLWTTRECPGSVSISFSRDLVNAHNGSIKARWGVYAFSIRDIFLSGAPDYIDFEQYKRDLDDELELWHREDLCTTRLPKHKRKNLSDILNF